MCTNLPSAFPGKPEFQALPGETWFIKNQPMKIISVAASYIDTSGDPSTKYVVLKDGMGEHHLITRRAFMDKAKREEPLVERFISPYQIMYAGACSEGAHVLFELIGLKFENDTFLDGLTLGASGKMHNSFKVSDLYHRHCREILSSRAKTRTSWLLFIAKALDLVPQSSNMSDRPTLMRLLGIKD